MSSALFDGSLLTFKVILKSIWSKLPVDMMYIQFVKSEWEEVATNISIWRLSYTQSRLFCDPKAAEMESKIHSRKLKNSMVSDQMKPMNQD